jgi:hypothetical protein
MRRRLPQWGDCCASQEIGQQGAHVSHPSARHRRYASIHSAPSGGGKTPMGRHGLDRCRYKGPVGMDRWVGLGVIPDNVVNISRAMEKQAAP